MMAVTPANAEYQSYGISEQIDYLLIPKTHIWRDNPRIWTIKKYLDSGSKFSLVYALQEADCDHNKLRYRSQTWVVRNDLEEDQILILGISINLAGIIGCIVLGRIEDRIGSEKVIKICIVSLLFTTLGLYFTFEKTIFWLLALLIGFFIGPIQAASRSLVSKRMESESQFSAFCVYSMFGNACSILGPFLVGIVIHLSSSIRTGLLVIPIFFLLSLFFLGRSNA